MIRLGSRFPATSSFSYLLLALTSCYAAVLRSTGEVKLPMRINVVALGVNTLLSLIMDAVAVYLIGIPLAFAGQSLWKFPAAGVFALITLQEIFKFILCTKRFTSKRWINNLVRDFSAFPATAGE